MIDSVVGLVEKHVDSGGSRFSESILRHSYFLQTDMFEHR